MMDIAIEGIEKLRAYWTAIGAPERLADYGIDDSKIDVMAKKAAINGPLGRFAQLSEEEVRSILEASL